MRANLIVAAAVLLGSSSLCPSFAQDPGSAPASSQPQAVPVQPERTPQQTDKTRDQDRQRSEDTRIGQDWRAQERDGDRMRRSDQTDTGRTGQLSGRDGDRDGQTVGRNWRTRPDDDRADRSGYRREYYDEVRPRHRVKVCVEYEDGGEYCRYRD